MKEKSRCRMSINIQLWSGLWICRRICINFLQKILHFDWVAVSGLNYMKLLEHHNVSKPEIALLVRWRTLWLEASRVERKQCSLETKKMKMYVYYIRNESFTQ